MSHYAQIIHFDWTTNSTALPSYWSRQIATLHYYHIINIVLFSDFEGRVSPTYILGIFKVNFYLDLHIKNYECLKFSEFMNLWAFSGGNNLWLREARKKWTTEYVRRGPHIKKNMVNSTINEFLLIFSCPSPPAFF